MTFNLHGSGGKKERGPLFAKGRGRKIASFCRKRGGKGNKKKKKRGEKGISSEKG